MLRLLTIFRGHIGHVRFPFAALALLPDSAAPLVSLRRPAFAAHITDGRKVEAL
ncbi:hypothetical protein YSA_07573 [Pseudomonas putida ND6]|uniref:Uncharacterized protein n=1 Tax=Pseudomonas putida ND6 TaxID=231023 RepID=I3UZD6_PSEPU|nr:hypothetical protein YSA_07573 [Pseudomonas putida ND6]